MMKKKNKKKLNFNNEKYGSEEIEMILSGDCELEIIIDALQFIIGILEKKAEETRRIY